MRIIKASYKFDDTFRSCQEHNENKEQTNHKWNEFVQYYNGKFSNYFIRNQK